LPVATRKRGRPKENKGYFHPYHKQAKKKRLERNDFDDRLEVEAAILNEEAEAIAREEETCNNIDLITPSLADSPLADESCEVEASTVSPYDLSADGMCKVDAATIDDPSVEEKKLNKKVFQINGTNFLVTY
jgi:hypothetical protein